MRFNKEIVTIIEKRFNIVLPDKNVEDGEITIDYSNDFGSRSDVYIRRLSTDRIYVTANFKNDDYKYIKGIVDTKGLRKLLKRL